ncbi:MAG: tetratricopeptide repeat protein, partial [Spirochaetales bacterium]|nr:tetratricopeptide repeat protein [Spirochaetales bacterium]
NNQKEAIKALTKAAELSPSSDEIQYELAESYFQLQDYENAEKLLLYLNNNSQSNKKAKIEEMLNAIKAQKEEAAADSENESQTTDNDDSDESTEN